MRDKIIKTENEIIDLLIERYDEQLGQEGLDDAWDEFLLWGKVEIPDKMKMDIQRAFIPWLLFSWCPVEHLDDATLADEPEMVDTTLASVYLGEYRARLELFQRKFMLQASRQPYSFFQVEGTGDGRTMALVDLMLGRRATVEMELEAGAGHAGVIIYAKVMDMEGYSATFGAFPVLIPPGFRDRLLDFRDTLKSPDGTVTPEILRYFETELRETYFEIFSECLAAPALCMVNMDGEPLVPVTLVYQLQCSPEEALAALSPLAGISRNKLRDKAVYNDAGEMTAASFAWEKKTDKKETARGGALMGHVQIEQDTLAVEVNSEERASSIQAEIQKRLKTKAILTHRETTALEVKAERDKPDDTVK